MKRVSPIFEGKVGFISNGRKYVVNFGIDPRTGEMIRATGFRLPMRYIIGDSIFVRLIKGCSNAMFVEEIV